MRAITVKNPGPDYTLATTDVPMPSVGAGQVLIRSVFAGVNRADIAQAMGRYPSPAGASEILGMECAGSIITCGRGVSGWEVGQPVCALVPGGGYGEYVVADAGTVLPVPAGASIEQAAALPEVACTVWSNIAMTAGIRPGHTVLIHGGSGGIGMTAIQVAKAVGARVFTTAGGAEHVAKCVELGADVAIDYRQQSFPDVIEKQTAGRGVDIVLDVVGAPYIDPNIRCLAANGKLVIIGTQQGSVGEIDIRKLMPKRASITCTTLRGRPLDERVAIVHEVVKNVWPMVAQGKFTPVIDTILPLDQAGQAHNLMREGKRFGKILLAF